MKGRYLCKGFLSVSFRQLHSEVGEPHHVLCGQCLRCCCGVTTQNCSVPLSSPEAVLNMAQKSQGSILWQYSVIDVYVQTKLISTHKYKPQQKRKTQWYKWLVLRRVDWFCWCLEQSWSNTVSNISMPFHYSRIMKSLRERHVERNRFEIIECNVTIVLHFFIITQVLKHELKIL